MQVIGFSLTKQLLKSKIKSRLLLIALSKYKNPNIDSLLQNIQNFMEENDNLEEFDETQRIYMIGVGHKDFITENYIFKC